MNPDYLIYCKESEEKGIGVKYSVPGRTPWRQIKIKRNGKSKTRWVHKKYPITPRTKIHFYKYQKNTTAEEIKRLEELCGSNDTYYVLHDINLNTIGRLKVGSLVNTVNHSTTPNCAWKNGYLVAIRKIEHGEFLSVNYGNTEFGKRIKIDEQKEKIKQKNIKKITEQVRKEAKNNGGYIRNKSNGRFASYKKEIEKRLKNNK